MVELDGTRHIVKLHDTAGQEEYDRLRKLVYQMVTHWPICVILK